MTAPNTRRYGWRSQTIRSAIRPANSSSTSRLYSLKKSKKSCQLRVSSAPLHHVNLSSILPELHLIHQLIDQEDSATMVGVQVLADRAGRNGFGIKPFAGIAYDDEHAALFIAGHDAFHNLAGIFLGTVNHRIRQRLLQRKLNGICLPIDAFGVADCGHHLLDNRIYRLAVGGELDTHTQT